MAAPINLQELTSTVQRVLGQGPLSQMLGGLGSGGGTGDIQSVIARLLPSSSPTASVNFSGSSFLPNNSIINEILQLLGGIAPSPFVPVARELINTRVLVTTTAGTVEGVLTEVGNWYLVLTETSGARVIVNLFNTLAIQPAATPEVGTI